MIRRILLDFTLPAVMCLCLIQATAVAQIIPTGDVVADDVLADVTTFPFGDFSHSLDTLVIGEAGTGGFSDPLFFGKLEILNGVQLEVAQTLILGESNEVENGFFVRETGQLRIFNDGVGPSGVAVPAGLRVGVDMVVGGGGDGGGMGGFLERGGTGVFTVEFGFASIENNLIIGEERNSQGRVIIDVEGQTEFSIPSFVSVGTDPRATVGGVPGGSMFVGHRGTGSVVVRNGALLETGPAWVGGGPDDPTDVMDPNVGAQAFGTVTLQGAGSRWLVRPSTTTPIPAPEDNNLTIGRRGNGLVEVISGAEVFFGETNEATTGPTRNTILGEITGGFGRIYLEGIRAHPTSPQFTGISRWRQSGDMTVGVDGVGEVEMAMEAVMEVRDLLVGSEGTGAGQVILNSGSLLEAGDDIVIASDLITGAEVIVRGEDTMLRAVNTPNDPVIDVGRGSQVGRLLVEDAGSVITETLNVDFGSNVELRNGFVEVSSGGLFNNGSISGYGTIAASAGAMIDNAGIIRTAANETLLNETLLISGEVENTNLLETIDGRFDFTHPVDNRTSGTIAVRDGEINFQAGLDNNGTLVSSFGISDIFGPIVNHDADLQNGRGTIIVAGNEGTTFYGHVTNDGTIQVFSEAQAIFAQGLTQSGTGTLSLRLAGDLDEDETAPVKVNGTAAIAGTLDVKFIDPMPLELGDSFLLLSSTSSVSGQFDFFDPPEPMLTGGLEWNLTYGNDVILNIVGPGQGMIPPEPPDDPNPMFISGDFDGDNFVGQGDLDLVLLNWGVDTSGSPPPGWSSNLPDNAVDQNELDQVLLNWGMSGSAIAASAVPEPSSVCLLACIAAFVLTAIRRSR